MVPAHQGSQGTPTHTLRTSKKPVSSSSRSTCISSGPAHTCLFVKERKARPPQGRIARTRRVVPHLHAVGRLCPAIRVLAAASHRSKHPSHELGRGRLQIGTVATQQHQLLVLTNPTELATVVRHEVLGPRGASWRPSRAHGHLAHIYRGKGIMRVQGHGNVGRSIPDRPHGRESRRPPCRAMLARAPRSPTSSQAPTGPPRSQPARRCLQRLEP